VDFGNPGDDGQQFAISEGAKVNFDLLYSGRGWGFELHFSMCFASCDTKHELKM
jgi:hypothetical protein